MRSSPIDFSGYTPVNHLWPELVELLGLEKAQRAVRQTLDLQRMFGDEETLPVLLIETCGMALVKLNSLRSQTGLACYGDDMILVLSTKEKLLQLLHEV